MRNRPYCVLLFDEMEKAHPDVFDTFLQLLDDGILTDGQGLTVNFRDAIVLFTSNAVCKSTSELGRRGQTSEFSSSVKSKSIRLIFGRIDCSQRVLEARRKCSCQNIQIRAH